MAGQAGPRGPYARGVARREELVRAALEIFAVRGYEAVSLREIAAQVGISHTGLRHHFASKEDLLMEVLRYKDQQTITSDVPVEVTGVDWVRASESVVEANAQHPLLIQLFATLSTQAIEPTHPAHRFFVERYRAARTIATSHLAQARDDGQVTADIDADLAAQLLLAVMDGLQIQWLLDPDALDMVSAYHLFLDRFLDALASPGPARQDPTHR